MAGVLKIGAAANIDTPPTSLDDSFADLETGGDSNTTGAGTGPLEVRRTFRNAANPGLTSWTLGPWSTDITLHGVSVSWISFKGGLWNMTNGDFDNGIDAFMSSMPNGHHAVMTFRHEPENDNIDAALWRDAQKYFHHYVRSNAGAFPQKTFEVAPVLMGVTFDPQNGDDLTLWVPVYEAGDTVPSGFSIGSPAWDVFGIDFYDLNNDAWRTREWFPTNGNIGLDSYLSLIVAEVNSYPGASYSRSQLKYGLAEMGTKKADSPSTEAVDWWEEILSEALADESWLAYITWFHNDAEGGNAPWDMPGSIQAEIKTNTATRYPGGATYIRKTFLDSFDVADTAGTIYVRKTFLDSFNVSSSDYDLTGEGLEARVGGDYLNIRENTLEIELAVEERSIAEFQIETDQTTDIRRGETVNVYLDGELFFAGFAVDPERILALPSDRVRWRVTAADFHQILDRRVVAGVWSDLTAGAIIRDIAKDHLEGVTVGQVDDGPTLEEFIVDYRHASDVFEELAELAGFTWWIDQYRKIWFVERSSVAAPWALKWAVIDDGPELSSQNPEYRNRQFIKGAKDETDEQTETFAGDGETQSFTVGYPISRKPTITVDTGGGPVTQSVGIRGVTTSAQWYWSKGSPVVTQDSGETALGSTDELAVTYRGQFPIVVLAENADEVARMATVEGGTTTGRYDQVDSETSMTRRNQAFQAATTRLYTYGSEIQTIDFRTDKDGLAPGQLLRVTVPEFGLDNTQFLLETVVARDVYGDVWYYVTGSTGPGGKWTRYWRWLNKRRDEFIPADQVDTDTVVATLEQTSEAWTWAEAVVTDVYACPVPATDLYPSTTLYPC